ncbi:ORF6N domain-containing protein, partial [Bacteroides intestinalis]|uniref:ORF6N domain-containing protein n=1 Tax=Bacteroides intestinalis TaxID=329854 RepID=UPI00321AB4A8
MELQVIQNKIYEFRGQKIMFDFDLAQLYGVETAQLKRSVKRNMERFEGEDFMFEVTREELVNVSKLWHNLFYAQSPDFAIPQSFCIFRHKVFRYGKVTFSSL